MIDVAELLEASLDEIRNLLNEEDTTEYQIYVPKSTVLFSSERTAIIEDYMSAAYSGQLLSGISEKFDYDEVSPAIHESIGFSITTKDRDLLATTILEISYLYGNERDGFEKNEYEIVEQFIDDVENDKIIPACPYFFEVRDEMLSEIEDDDNDDD
ncbi:MAG: hypothetical protein DI535_14155 [Citrobacter freundii]|nr:MAG: hypothetical protein DI535_14155 [Citrobacter freundii]